MTDIYSRDWYYDEFQQIGLDFESADEVKRYDDEIGAGINQRDNCAEIAKAVGLRPTDRVLEIGTATGRLAIDLSYICVQVTAIDISRAMLDFAAEKARKRGQDNIEFILAGFLSYRCEDGAFDAVITKFSLHHLPDHWKFVAVKRIYDMLVPGGKLYLKDAMVSVDIHEFYDSADYWVEGTREMSGDRPAQATALCIKEEYPTYAWIMEGMLERAGFRIDHANHMYGLHSTFVCVKPR